MNRENKNDDSADHRIKQGFINAYETHADALFRFCFFRLYDREQAKDITQEIFTKTWDYIRKGNHIKNIKAFLYTTARHLIIDHARKRKETSLEQLQENGFNPGQNQTQTRDTEFQTALGAIRKLDEKYREVILLRHVEGFSPREIAKMLGETENAVSVRIHRGLHLLRKCLNH